MIYKHYFMEGTTYSNKDAPWHIRMSFFKWTSPAKVFTSMKTAVAESFSKGGYDNIHVRTFNRVF